MRRSVLVRIRSRRASSATSIPGFPAEARILTPQRKKNTVPGARAPQIVSTFRHAHFRLCCGKELALSYFPNGVDSG